MALILGIETSCDETAAAVYDSGAGIRSSCLFSQIELHKQFGGVVPEIASRSHLEKIGIITQRALDEASATLQDIGVVAVTHKPGLPGSLLVGLCFAKAIAWSLQKKIIGINHLEGHIFSSCIEHYVPFPHLCIAASGGHTSLYRVIGLGSYECIGRTVDDAAGEAFDKVAKLIGIPYPGGPMIEKMAQDIGFEDFFRYPRAHVDSLNFSFSGIKTAVLYDLVKRQAYNMHTKTFLKPHDEILKKQVASSLLTCIADIFGDRLHNALKMYPDIHAVTFVGGVACNKYIKSRLQQLCAQHSVPLISPSPRYCTDNAAMIAFVGNYKASQGNFDNYSIDICTNERGHSF
jgi:N6-L-threonylcarbamoyladenine synthase